MNAYDVIVLGTGGVGSAAAFHLARRGLTVLGLDRFPGGHAYGGSHGQTRIIRKAYFEHPDYVPLLHRAYELWHELEELRGEQLYREVGLLEVGPPDGVVIPGVLQSARQHNLPLEQLDERQFPSRFPGFVLPDPCRAVFEQQAGFLFVEQCVLAHLAEAARCGAELRTDVEVVGWEASGQGVTVRTRDARYTGASLVVTAGAWSGSLLADLGIPLTVRRKHLHWYACDDARYRADQGCPAFFYETPSGCFYGFPRIDDGGVKAANHSGGTEVDDPLSDDKSVEVDDRRRVESFLQRHLPGVLLNPTRHAVCYYTMSPDEHFLVDQHPEHPQIFFTAGLSGHGFKFTSVLGELLADLVVHQRASLPIRFLSIQRPGLRPVRG